MGSDGDEPRVTAQPAEIRETHAAIVVLVGDHAYKVKKPVDLGFLDFRTEPARHRACLREVELNRRLAPDVYLDVATVSGSDGRVRDHVIVMRRMPDAVRLSSLISRRVDVEDHLRALARMIAAFHADADRGPRIAAQGSAAALRRRWSDNLAETEKFRGTVLDTTLHQRIDDLALRYVDGREPLLAERAAAGLVVDGHGDLMAEDVFCLPDHPRVLDCLEFDDRLRWVDVLDDVAFLAMDLEHLGRPDLAERFLGWYAGFAGTPTVVSLRHHYVAYRAFVRAKVACIRAAQGAPTQSAEAGALARLALDHLQAGEVTLTLVGGAPGTGKTTLARGLAERLDGVLLSSDVVRQELLGPVAVERYGDAAKAATYRELLARARHALHHGRSVVADATWTTTRMRDLAVEVAVVTRSRIVALECQAPVEVAAARAEHRLTAGRDASEAGMAVARRLAARRDPWPDAEPIRTTVATHEALDAALRAYAASEDRSAATTGQPVPG